MAGRIRLLLLIPHLGGGGAEQVIALLARGLPAHKYELHVGLATQSEAARTGLPEWVTVHPVGARRVRAAALPLLQLVRQLRPDVVLSGIAHLNFLVLLLRPFFPRGTRVLVRQNATVSTELAGGLCRWFTRPLYRMLYRHSDAVICQSRAMADDIAVELGLGARRLAVLPNPVDLDGARAAHNSPSLWQGPGPHLLAVGRLAHEKGFDLLLEAFARVRRKFAHADLTIAGEGSLRAILEAQSEQLGLKDTIRFAGHVDRPYRFYSGATLFVLSSRREGMPNALLEAAAAGLPLAALPASGGLVDLLAGRPGAWLASAVSASALAETLLAALQALEPEQRFEHGFLSSKKAGNSSGEFSFARAIEGYDELIDAVYSAERA